MRYVVFPTSSKVQHLIKKDKTLCGIGLISRFSSVFEERGNNQCVKCLAKIERKRKPVKED
jgi:hypothetical protein